MKRIKGIESALSNTSLAAVLALSLGACSDKSDDASSKADATDSSAADGSGGSGGGDTSNSGGSGGSAANDSDANGSDASGGDSSSNDNTTSGASDTGSGGNSESNGDSSTGGVEVENPLTDPESGPPAGRSDTSCTIPSEAGLEDSSSPDHVVGQGSPESCTADAFIEAVAQGGVVTFDCGSEPHIITLDRPAKVFNDAAEEVVIDGGGLVTLSGGGATRILYMNTCDEDQHWTSDHCDNQDNPRLTVQNLTFIDANSKSETEYDGGGAIWVRGGQFKVVNSRFFN